jgi:hypothetical protein
MKVVMKEQVVHTHIYIYGMKLYLGINFVIIKLQLNFSTWKTS